MKLKNIVFLMLLACTIACAGVSVRADDIKLYDPRSEADIEAWGKPPIKFGSFLLFSDVTLSQSYNDNILALENDEEGDFVTSVKPTAQIVKSFGRHNFGVAVGGDVQRYWQNSDENTVDYNAAFMGNLEAYHSFNIPFTLAYSKEHQDRSNRRLNSVTQEPVKYDRKVAKTGFIYEPNRLRLEVIGQYEEFRVEDSKLLVTGAPVTGKDKDRDSLYFETILSYDVRPNWKPLVKFQYTDNTYLERMQTPTGFNGLNRNNQVFRALAGFIFDFKGLIGGTALFGQEKREYEEIGAESVDGFSSEITINFAPTERLKGQLGYLERTNDDNLLLTGVAEKVYTLDLTQEIRSDLYAKAGASYRNTEYLTSSRVDDKYGAYGSLVYKVNRGLELEGSYKYQQRDSIAPGLSFDQSIFMLSLKNQF